ncbi:polysaccharide biosynthesis/export family protein [Agriterribacter sp.]|uniref:polysaccharide biosynthesis/export family protein n=1 Tax=Agriterribacter sp. TaxID=2821509 RepID=UPI002C387CA8|nr:polysaccharide biosynthesis/export family protein [Agriterribacter sp.]HRO44584.1 polysaccharide biosynthesis/export family protein [Agriterribacter sp.]HRQ16021.1 polysaccharide biosynthesis/export family protein [Agriterribacter sp.]
MTIHKCIYHNTFFTLALSLLLFSCRTTRPVQYLQGPIDTAALSRISLPEPLIQKGDLIGITVYSDNPEVTAVFNQQMNTTLATGAASGAGTATGTTGTAAQSMPGYLVDANGNIRFQLLGELHVEGLTKAGLEHMLKEKLAKYLMNPYCNIRFLNYRFTMLGEVTKQGIYSIPGERISILEALGMAGDINMFGLKDSIMVVRETNGKRSFGYLDVSNPEVFTSPYYYLQQNDIIIVKTNPKKPDVSEQTANRNFARAATISSILLSLTLVLVQIFR